MTPYNKKPKIVDTLLPLDSNCRISSENYDNSLLMKSNFVWMLSHALEIPKTPMWVGFQSLIQTDNSFKQKVSYLTTINLSPTNNAVVLETLNKSQNIAKECREEYMQVTYDLAIAKLALQIQSSESPKFDNLFIHLGPFHIFFTLFKVIGKFIDNCGLTNVMADSELLASGSINSFLAGKHFNRCKRLHPMMSLSLQILHFQKFLEETNEELPEDIIMFLKYYTGNESQDIEGSESVKHLFERCELYKEETMKGTHGKTAQFYLIYIQLVDYYLTLNASIRTSNFNQFIFILPKISNLFFVFNHQNYARWLVKYHNNLINVDETHPGLRSDFQKGTFGVKRTDKPFSKQPIDLTLEQTINADAAKSLTGISHFTNSISARQRWCNSHSLRTAIVSHVLEEAGLTKPQDVTADLQQSRIVKSSLQVKRFMNAIKQNVNPFDKNLGKDQIFNISSGQGASQEITHFLTNVEEIGNNLRESFISECAVDESRFEKPLKKYQTLTFSNTLKKKKLKLRVKYKRFLWKEISLEDSWVSH